MEDTALPNPNLNPAPRCGGHGMEDAVLDELALPVTLVERGDANGDGALSNIEFYAAIDPAASVCLGRNVGGGLTGFK